MFSRKLFSVKRRGIIRSLFSQSIDFFEKIFFGDKTHSLAQSDERINDIIAQIIGEG